MLIGTHVSPAGGPAKAVARGLERGARAIQIFNQNPRAWKPTIYSDEAVADFRTAMADSDVDALLIHAVYLLNAASEDPDIRAKTLTSLTTSLQAGDALGAVSVVLHPGSALTGEVAPAIKRAGAVIREALAESENCPLHLENTAGAGGTLGRSFHELAGLIDAAGGDDRLGMCLDSCHLYASGFDIQGGLGSNRDRHADIGQGELGEDGCAVFLSEPRFDGLPVILETPGPDKKGTPPEELALAVALRERGIKRRGR
jgi:deoxyribonuclease-4